MHALARMPRHEHSTCDCCLQMHARQLATHAYCACLSSRPGAVSKLDCQRGLWLAYKQALMRNAACSSSRQPLLAAHLSRGCRLYLRNERQTLKRLPKTQAVLFTIRTYTKHLRDIAGRPELCSRLTNALTVTPDEFVSPLRLKSIVCHLPIYIYAVSSADHALDSNKTGPDIWCMHRHCSACDQKLFAMRAVCMHVCI